MLIFKKVKIILLCIYNFVIILGIELWAENIKGKNDPKQEPYFKVRNYYKNFM